LRVSWIGGLGDSYGAAMDGTIARSDVWSERLLAIVSGRATSAQIESWVDAAWRDGQFADSLPRDTVDRLPTTGRRVTRYGDHGILRSEVCFEHPHGPGGVVISTPPQEVWSRVCTRWYVAPHVHRHAHVTVVLQGEPLFFIARAAGEQAYVVEAAVHRGNILFCPAAVAHTLGSTGAGFTVLSIQARFVDPSQPDFARNANGFGQLPRRGFSSESRSTRLSTVNC
jgi:hypothetical protein